MAFVALLCEVKYMIVKISSKTFYIDQNQFQTKTKHVKTRWTEKDHTKDFDISGLCFQFLSPPGRPPPSHMEK